MKAIATTGLSKSLEDLIAEVIDDAEPTLISAGEGRQAVLVPLEEFNAWQETMYLLSNPANAEHLRRSVAEAEAGEVTQRELVEA